MNRTFSVGAMTVLRVTGIIITAIGLGCAAALLCQQSLSAQASPSSNVASMKVEGRLIKIQGRYYVIMDSQGKEIYLMVSQDTELTGTFKVGDRIAIWTSPIEHAIAIRATALDQEPETIGAATRTISGQLIAIEGKYYVMLDREGKEIRLLVSQDTELAGEFAAGDQIEVFTSPVEHAVTIKAAP